MPKITEYNEQVSAPGAVSLPSISAATFGGGEGLARLGQGVSDVGAVLQDVAEHKEISEVNARMAEVADQTTADWLETIKDPNAPNDPQVTEEFMRRYDERVAKVQEGILTRKAQETYARTNTSFRSKFFQSAIEGQAALAGEKAVLDKQKERASYTAAVLKDPSFAETYREKLRESIFGDKRFATSVAAQKAWQESDMDLTQNEVRGWISLNPHRTKRELEQGRWDEHISGDLKKQLVGEADREIQAALADQARQRAEDKRVKEEAQEVTKLQFVKKWQDGSLTAKEIVRSNLDSAEQLQYIKLLNSEPSSKGGSVAYRDLLRRVHLPEGDPEKVSTDGPVIQAMIDAQITRTEGDWLIGDLRGRKTADGQFENDLMTSHLSRYTKVLDRSTLNNIDGEGATRAAAYESYVRRKVKQYRDQGKSIETLFDEKSPDFVGNQLGSFTLSIVEQGRNIAKKAKPAAPPKEEKPKLDPKDFGKILKEKGLGGG